MDSSLEQKRLMLIKNEFIHYKISEYGIGSPLSFEEYNEILTTFPKEEQDVIDLIGPNSMDTIEKRNLIFNFQENNSFSILLDVIDDKAGLWPMIPYQIDKCNPTCSDDIEEFKRYFKQWAVSEGQKYIVEDLNVFDNCIFCSVCPDFNILKECTPERWFRELKAKGYYQRAQSETILFMHNVVDKLNWVGCEIIHADQDLYGDGLFFFSEAYSKKYEDVIEAFQENDIPCKRVIKKEGVLSMEILWE